MEDSILIFSFNLVLNLCNVLYMSAWYDSPWRWSVMDRNMSEVQSFKCKTLCILSDIILLFYIVRWNWPLQRLVEYLCSCHIYIYFFPQLDRQAPARRCSEFLLDRLSSSHHRLLNLHETRRTTERWQSVRLVLIGRTKKKHPIYLPS
jgi:hypothetical protein